MGPAYGIMSWIIVGAVVGWLASKLLGLRARRGGVANVLLGAIGAVAAGLVGRVFLGDQATHDFATGLLLALGGAVVLVGVYRAIAGKRVARVAR